MIIRLSVNDNDYTEELEKFALSLNNLLRFIEWPKDASLEEAEKIIEQKDKIDQILSPVATKKYPTFSELKWLENLINDKWKEYIKTWCRQEVELLKDDLEIDCQFYFVESNENGEAVYYFTKTGRFITQ